MFKEVKLITKLHQSTKRNYLQRMNDNKIKCMKVAKKFESQYWDGKRRFGYGGYKYIPGRFENMAKNLIKEYKIKSNSRVLDIGCGKGYLMYEIKKIIPEIKVYGLDISRYAIKASKKNFKNNFFVHDASKKLPFKKNYFDLTLSINVLHNLKINDFEKAIKEINRVSRKSFIVLESYNNEKELFNLQCWALTCQSFFSKDEWKWLFKRFKYSGDFEFIFFR